MKKKTITQATWALIIAGSVMMGACKNNNDGAIAQNTDTATVTPLYGSATTSVPASADTANGLTNSGTAATNTFTSPNTSTATTASSANGCPVPAHKAVYHRYTRYSAVRRHKTIRRKTGITNTTEENNYVATQPSTPVINNNTTQDFVSVEKPAEQPAAETQNVYFGNVTQTPKKPAAVHLAIEAGGTANNLYRMSDDFQTSNMLKAGFSAGAMVNIRLGDHFAVEPGLRYIMKGAVIKSSSNDGVLATDEKDKLTFHYIEMPLNFVYNSGGWGTSHFMLGVGPYASYLVNAQDKRKVTTTNIAENATTVTEGQHSLPVGNRNTPGNVSYYDAGAGGFIGWQFKTGTYVKAGAEVGLIDLQENVQTLGNFNDRNYNFLLSVGYMMGYNKK